MPVHIARRTAPVREVEPLPATYWTRIEHVRVPGGTDRIDLVVVGPSGVHVVLDRPGATDGRSRRTAPGTPEVGAGDLEETVQGATAAAAAVAALLPARYRRVVAPAVCLRGTTASGDTVGTVLAASPDVLRHAWRHGPRVLSTSEATVIAGLLRHRLEPFPLPPAAGGGRWWRRWARRLRPGGRGRRLVTAASAAPAASRAGGIPSPR